MDLNQERRLAQELQLDEKTRDRNRFDYTVDALQNGGILPNSIWPESNQRVSSVLQKKVDINDLPFDESNEFHKGMRFTGQQDIILKNIRNDRKPLCEAQEMDPCLQESCKLYYTELTPPVCREYKMVFKK